MQILKTFEHIHMSSNRKKARKYRIKRSDSEWQRYLKPNEYEVLRMGQLSKPWRGEYLEFYPIDGVFACRGCGAKLYAADRKFDDASGFCAFDQCFDGKLYCSGVDISTNEKVWKANCTGCGCNIARVTRGEQRTHRNERHVVSSLSIKHIAGENMVGARLPRQGPLNISEEYQDTSSSSTSTSDSNSNSNSNSTSTNSTTTSPPAPKAKKKQPSIQLSETEKARGKRGHTERPCEHLLSTIKQLRIFQSLAKIISDKGHQTCSGMGDVAGTVNLPCSEADDKEIPGISTGFEGCRDCRRSHTPMHRCQRYYTWICLHPGCRSKCMCVKYSQKHYKTNGADHCIMLTPGLAVYCFQCDRLVNDLRLSRLLRQAHLSRFGTLPLKGAPPIGIDNGASILRNKLGYQNAQACTCSLCNPAEKPRKKLPKFVVVPNMPSPPHPSYISLPLAKQGGSSSNSSEILNRLKGMIVGAALGDALGQLTTGMSREIVHVVFKDLVKTKKLNFQHIKLRPKRRRPPAKGHNIGEWTPCADLMIVSLQSMCAFGGRFETSDVSLRLARYAQEGLTVEKHSRGKKIGEFIKQGAVTSFVSRVIGDNLEDFTQNASQLAYEAEQAYSANPLATSGNEAIFRSFLFATRKFDNNETVMNTVRKACRITHASTRAVASALAVGGSIAMMLNGKYTWNSGGNATCKVMQRDAYFAACADSAMNIHQREFRQTLLFGIADPPGRVFTGEDEEEMTLSEEEYAAQYEEEERPQSREYNNNCDWNEYVEHKERDEHEYKQDNEHDNGNNGKSDNEHENENENEQEQEDDPKIGLEFLGLDHSIEGSQALKTAAVAFWAQRYPQAEYMDAVLEVILQGGDASANGCIAGAIMGMRCGFSKLPTHWLAHLRGKDWLSELADKYNILLWEGH